ncbi:ABC transporter substrate-binding protein [Epidermidibacterium keratini]|uniref:ABC transporter substrate-binding protein n=1 Tax=Epidermidibacterium keratini TaxID=1891644 RepID=A0A7L4YPX2_9ACTN|nr:ABC transporter substrate-binding protein [Epidermidibacterium keratini]QHC01118.1 ABC transporter substrate-binding protein [Epidermidibacterium keratini]
MRKMTLTTACLGTALAITISGCSTKAQDSSGGGSGSDGVKTDIGVSDNEILLGVQSDLSGVFKSIGLALTHGNELWVEDVNAEGGVCGRDIKLDIQDNAYKADNAVPLYEQQKTSILGYLQLIGSPVLAALKQKLTADKVLAIPAAQASQNMDSPSVLLIGATYDVEMINGLSWMKEQGTLSEGDKIGHIYVDSEYGQNGLMGSKYFAEENGMTVVEAPVAATDTDMTAIVAKFKEEGVKAIALTTTPAATASVAVQNTTQNLNVPMMGSNPSFTPNMLSDSSVVSALENMYVSSGTMPFGGPSPLAEKIKSEYDKKFSADQPNYAVNAGYSEGLVWTEVLKKACDNGDLTREGILKARTEVTSVSTDGMNGEQDLSDPGAPATRESFITKPDPNVPGGLSIVSDLAASDAAKSYKAPHQK